MTISLILSAILASNAPTPQAVFNCRAGSKRVAVNLLADRLTYSFGLPGRPDISLTGDPQRGVFYHRTMYNRGEDQTLRFVQGPWSYIVFNRWQAPQQSSSERVEPEYNVSGVLVMKGDQLVRRIDCNKGSGNLIEWPIFKRLKQDEENLTPDDA